MRKVDLTDYICGPRACPPVVGNVLVYRDDAHMTNTYAATLGPYLEAELAAALATRGRVGEKARLDRAGP